MGQFQHVDCQRISCVFHLDFLGKKAYNRGITKGLSAYRL